MAGTRMGSGTVQKTRKRRFRPVLDAGVTSTAMCDAVSGVTQVHAITRCRPTATLSGRDPAGPKFPYFRLVLKSALICLPTAPPPSLIFGHCD